MRICFFARVESSGIFETVEFYRQDIEILRHLGHDVVVARRWWEIPWDADLYYVWWWNWAFQPLLVARLRRKPVIVTGVLDYPYPFPDRGLPGRPFWQREIISWALASADRNVFLSRHEADGAPRGLEVRNPRCIPLGVDTDVYSPGSGPREGFVMTVLWMERFNVWRKCGLEILQAVPAVLARHPETRFVIVGERHNGFGEMEAQVRKLGLERVVAFPGVISREEKIDLMRRCRLYLQPTRYEGFGAAILEAMSCGAPVVTNPVGSVPEVVGDAGYLMADPAAPTIAAAVNELWQDPARRDELAARARRRAVERFRLDVRRDALRDLLAELGEIKS